MALVKIEGFELERNDFYLDRKYESEAWNEVTGRDGGRGIRGGSSTGWFTLYSQAGQENSWVIGIDVKGVQGFFPDGGVRFLTSSNVQFTMNFVRGVNGNSQQDIEIQLTDGTTVYTVPERILDDKWTYVELVITVRDGVNGSFEVFYDGVSKLSQVGIDTAQQGTDGADEVQVGLSSSIHYDNIYLLTGTGTPNTRQGPIYVTGLLPNGDTLISAEDEWTAFGGGTKFSKVDDDPGAVTFQTDKITAAAANLEQLMLWENMADSTIPPISAASIIGMSVGLWGAMDGSGTRDVAVRFKDTSSGTPVNGSSTWSVVGTVQQYHEQVWADNPVTASAFTQSQIDAMEMGVATLT